jgi:hypothetical protein
VLDPVVPLGDVEADVGFATLGAGYTFDALGRQARLMALLPYAWGELSAAASGAPAVENLDGLVDPRIKFSIGLWGAPALSTDEFANRRRATSISASLTVMPPFGRYEGDRLASLGANRWAFKPEIGVWHPIGRWTLEASLGAWFYTENDDYLGGVRSQDPITAVASHVSYTFGDRSWLALNATLFFGGRTDVDGVRNDDEQDNMRFGLTYSRPITQRQSIKFTYSTGARTRRGSDFDTFTLTWQLVRF